VHANKNGEKEKKKMVCRQTRMVKRKNRQRTDGQANKNGEKKKN